MSDVFGPVKLDFSSFYKFVSSIGLLLLAAAVALPWFALRATAPNAPAGTEASSNVDLALDARAQQFLFIVSVYPWLSGVLFVLGSVLTGYGLFAWRSRQKKQDADEDETYRQRAELGQSSKASSEDREEKLDQEAVEGDTSRDKGSAGLAGDGERKKVVSEPLERLDTATRDRYRVRRELITRAEERVEKLLGAAFIDTHQIETGVRLSGPRSPILDLVARAKDGDRWTSFAIEVRVVDRSPSTAPRLRDAMLAVAIAARDVPEGQVQVQRVGRPPIAKSVSICLVVVSDEDRGIRQSTQVASLSFKDRLSATVEVVNAVLLRKTGVICISQSEFEKTSAAWLQEKILEVMQRPELAMIRL
ncbi:hypothetical protein E8P82_13825 [Arthrobacter echini]|uniref:Uncharacterized protein n=1 Tax=Arthrobacter echini TaxID=1529066 RepID=A0A4S5E0P1_9MICC|nr:hypothetical protein [Arthrobacter echini]THJ64853.1 hypothetical protein E8P82_13825 [Arthrobacter echini]